MNNDRFEVGEVAIYWRPESPGHLSEVTITSELGYGLIQDEVTGEEFMGWAYDIVDPTFPGDDCCALPRDLRKKRPPQDWRTLCKLDSVPKTEPMEVAP